MLNADHSDHALAAEAAAGRSEAFGELVRRYQGRVRAVVRRLSRDEGDVDDLVQDIFIRAYCGIGQFRGDSAFWSWLYRIAANVILDHRGRRGRSHAALPDTDDDGLDRDVAGAEDLELRVVRRLAIERALASLPPDLRRVVILREIEGLQYEEIAAIVRLPRGTVDSRLHRARRKLRPLLEPLRDARAPPDAREEKPPPRSLTHRRIDRIE